MEPSGANPKDLDAAISGQHQTASSSAHDLRTQTKVGDVEDSFARDYHGIDTRAIPTGTGEVYERKVAIMNQALIDIGMGSFQWKIFAMTGFGWFVDNVCPLQPM